MSCAETVVSYIERSPLFAHPFFRNWSQLSCSPEMLGALFHQIQHFCAATRPGLNFPESLRKFGLISQAELLQEIVDEEEGHGRELAEMAYYLMQQAGYDSDLLRPSEQADIESLLRDCSNRVVQSLELDYDPRTGLLLQTQAAIGVFASRAETDFRSTCISLGVSIGLEIISNRHLIPGEYLALVQAGHYGVRLEDGQMQYLREHMGENGAEAGHERRVLFVAEEIYETGNREMIGFMESGIDAFLLSLKDLWDALDRMLQYQRVRS